MSGAAMVRATLQEAAESLSRLQSDDAMLERIAQAGELLATTFTAGGKAYACGNGLAISDPSHLSCVGNDYGYEQVFARFVAAHGRPGDVLLAITTSGTSRNVVAAAQTARQLGMKTIALTGRAATPIVELADIAIVTPGGRYADRVQELHIKVIHILIELVERRLAPANYGVNHAAP